MSKEAIDTVINTLAVLVLIAVLMWSLFNLRRDSTITLLLLIGVWFLDMYLKRIYKFDNTTVFADLSFSSFVFSLGRAISLIDAINEPSVDYIFQLVVITFALFLLWLGNLNICNYITIYKASYLGVKGVGYWISSFVSLLFALLSAIFVLAPQIIEAT